MATQNYIILTIAVYLTIFCKYVLADCTTFEKSTDYYSTTSNHSQIISRGYVCNKPSSQVEFPDQMKCNSTQCATVGYGTVTSTGTNNLSLSESAASSLYTLIQQTGSKPSFPQELSGDTGRISSCLNVASNYSGYYTFTPYLMCIEGVLSGCSNGPVESNTAITICAPKSYGSGDLQPFGIITFVYTDPESAAAISMNPARNLSTPTSSTPTSSGTPSSSETPGGAERSVPFGGIAKALGTTLWLASCVVLGSILM